MNGFTGQLGVPNALPGNVEPGLESPSVPPTSFPNPTIPSEQSIAPIPNGDGSTFQWGGTFLPIAKQVANAVVLPWWATNYAFLRDADPARFFLIDFFVWSFNFALSQRLALESEGISQPIRKAVNSVALIDPEPFFATESTTFQYPLLSVYRKKSRGQYVSTTYPYRDGTWEMRYVLPSMGFESASKLEPMLHGIEATIESIVNQGYHPQYAPPGQQPGYPPFLAGGGMEVQTGESKWEYAQPDEGIVHLLYTMELFVKVRKMDVRTPAGATAVRGAPVPMSGVDYTVAISQEGGDPSGEGPIPVAVVRTDAANPTTILEP